jgi:hypothetical protein
MRLCGAFRGPEQVSCPEERPEAHGVTRESIRPALLPVDDADSRLHHEARSAERLDRIEQRAAGRDDVLDEADALTLLVRALDALRGAVFLRLLADDDERQAGLQRRRGGQRDRSELRTGEPRCVGGMLAYRGGDPLAERLQQVRARLEPVLVEVVA